MSKSSKNDCLKKPLIAVNEDSSQVFEKLYANHYEELCIYLLNYTPDKGKIEDIVQETFIALWSKRNDLIIRDSLKSYLFRSAYNNLISTFRKNKKTDDMLESYYHTAIMLATNLDEDLKNERLKKLDSCIDNLPSRCKDVFISNKISGKKYQQVAIEMNISLKTVEGHITNAYKSIKTCMGIQKTN